MLDLFIIINLFIIILKDVLFFIALYTGLYLLNLLSICDFFLLNVSALSHQDTNSTNSQEWALFLK